MPCSLCLLWPRAGSVGLCTIYEADNGIISAHAPRLGLLRCDRTWFANLQAFVRAFCSFLVKPYARLLSDALLSLKRFCVHGGSNAHSARHAVLHKAHACPACTARAVLKNLALPAVCTYGSRFTSTFSVFVVVVAFCGVAASGWCSSDMWRRTRTRARSSSGRDGRTSSRSTRSPGELL